MEPAPFLVPLSEGPETVRAFYVKASDGVRIRLCLWSVNDPKGTVILFTGRTEYGEKYGHVAREVTQRGYNLAVIDWRGQGASDRLLSDPRIGHVERFQDYQLDADAAEHLLADLGVPRPWFAVAHSMGGAIGLRKLLRGFDVQGMVFSAPMWGIQMSAANRIFSRILPPFIRAIGRQNAYVFGMSGDHYVMETKFSENVLTGDKDQYAFLRRNAVEAPHLGIGGPSFNWLFEAMKECAALRRAPKPETDVLVLMGTEESTVDPSNVRQVVDHWPTARLDLIKGARHEMMMETPDLRAAFFDRAFAYFEANQKV